MPLQWLVEAVGAEMTLWQLLILTCIAVPIGTAYASAQQGRYGLGAYTLAIGVGSAVGMCFGWVMYAAHKIVSEKLQRGAPSETSLVKQEWFFRGFYLAKILWIALAGFLGFWLSSVLLRIVIGGPV